MTNEQILKKAIEKAKKNGWETDIISVNPGYESSFIFSHDFAKAFWGEEHYDEYVWVKKELLKCRGGAIPIMEHSVWQYHLQQMVLVEDKLKYIEKFL